MEAITAVLQAAQSADAAVRQQAEQQMEQAKQSNLPLFMNSLATELSNEVQEPQNRQLAGVLLKNCVAAPGEESAALKKAAWLAIDAAQRDHIKNTVLGCLASPQVQARQTAAQVIGAVGVIELPEGQWPTLIQGLCNNVTTSGNDCLKQSSLQALGYVCEEIQTDHVQSQANLILTAVIQGMRKEEANLDVRLAGSQALHNSLEFVKANFEAEVERNYIMQTVCEGTQASRKDVKLSAYECIVEIAELYYDKLPAYMEALYTLTLEAIQKVTKDEEEDEVGQQAVEFWSTVAETELELQEEAEEARLANRQPERVCRNFVRQGMGHLVALLLEAMCKQEEDGDDDSWNMAMAAGTCLAKIAQTAGDEIVPHVLPFIEKHIKDANWRRREASALAYGSILEGPSQQALAPYMQAAISMMIAMMGDPSVPVRDTAAWTIGRICEHHHATFTSEHWQLMMQEGGANVPQGVLLAGLKDDPRVAGNVCWALHNLAEQLEDSRGNKSNPLSPLFVTIARALLQCTERPDAGENNLRSSAYEALNSVLQNAAEDTHQQVEQLLPVILQRLSGTFQMQIVSNDDREAQIELQGLLCSTLQVITQKLGQGAVHHADSMMQLFLQVFGAKNSTVQEEALMAVGAVANATEAAFEKYMPHFRPFLSLGLSNYEEHQVCAVAIGVVGDICRALETKVLPYCDEIIHLLLRNLQNPALNRNVKPPILSCFGDIALAIGGHFEKYMQVTMSMLVQAQGTTVDMSNPDLVDYLNQLREGIFEAYTGVLQGLRADEKSAVFEPYTMGAFDLIRQVAEAIPEGTPTDDVIRAAAGVVGDLGSSLGARGLKNIAKQSPHKEYLNALLKAAKESSNDQTKQIAVWAKQAMFSS